MMSLVCSAPAWHPACGADLNVGSISYAARVCSVFAVVLYAVVCEVHRVSANLWQPCTSCLESPPYARFHEREKSLHICSRKYLHRANRLGLVDGIVSVDNL